MFKKITCTLKAIRNIPLFILEFLGLVKDRDVTYTTYYDRSLTVRAGTTDIKDLIIIYSDDEYPKKYYPKCYEPVILDIGANIGAFTTYISHHLKQYNPIIYSIEPNRANFGYLTKNIEANNLNNVTCVNLAIGSKDGTGNLRNDTDFDSCYLTDDDLVPSELVQIQTLQTFCTKNKINVIDLIKIDIEGSEYEVVKSSISFIKRNCKSLFVEIHNLDSTKNINTFINSLEGTGLIVEKIIMGRTVYITNSNLKK